MTNNETQREVFDDLLQRYIGCMDITPLAAAELYNKWINRFDTAATRTAAIDVFVEALSKRLKDWVKEQAVETAQWKRDEPFV